jgi:hypothetical protein
MGPGTTYRSLAIVAVAGSVGLGLLLLGIAWQTLQQRLLFVADSWPIRANVVALQPLGDDMGRADPVVSFTTFKGEQVRIRLPGEDLSPGSTVNLLYDEDEPETVLINDYWHLWFTPWAFGVAGASLTLIPAVAIVWVGRRKRL